MSPVRTLKSAGMSTTESNRQVARQNARKLILEVYDAIRRGNIHVNRPDPNLPFRPRMEVYNDPDSPNIIATFEVPGVKITDLTISVKQGHLLIQGERHPKYRARRHPSVRGLRETSAGEMDVDSQPSAPNSVNARFFPYEELRYGAFARRLRLPPGVDTSCIGASLSDGLLTVSWPRSPPATRQADDSSMATSIERPTSSVRAEPHGRSGTDHSAHAE
ncbi:HSP20-like chaperone [Mycena alexandri]|uniref:HSP20-like chaperone n=1 Tax=Mycena alexandri TaxID=1745969 RepID=A0AAD6SL67_9AGAR|nr:HSP20-like chaperone [Mycena alexandri]